MIALACDTLTKIYGHGTLAETALAGVSLSFDAGESCVLLGPSGSGKTTLLSILGCLLSPSSGSVQIEGQPVNYASQERLTHLRRSKIGFVFQHAQLLPFISVRENLRIVAENGGVKPREVARRLAALLERLGIAQYAHRKPGDLSGGQRQRAAVARSLLHRPQIILADEPTAALDWEHGQAVIALLIEQAKNDGALLIVVTHDTRLVDLFDRVVRVESGKVVAVSA